MGMGREAKCLLSAVVALLLASPASAQVDEAAAVLMVEDARIAATEQRDVPAIADFLTDDFVNISERGAVSSRDQYLARQQELAEQGSTAEFHHTDVRVRVYGSAAVVTGHAVVTRPGRADDSVTRFTHIYIKQGEGWKLASMHSSPAR